MDKCYKCGDKIEFRHQGGSIVPIHQSGWCSHSSHGSSSAAEYGELRGYRSLSISQSSFTHSSYTNPNARCPVCSERVFFYQSPYEGRVFFDELGPPWPKHPCTDNSVHLNVIDVLSDEPPPEKRYKWQEEGWEPFLWTRIEQDEGGMSRIIGRPQNDLSVWTLTVFGSLSKLVGEYIRECPMFLRPTDRENRKYKVTTVKFGGNGQVREIYFDAYRKK